MGLHLDILACWRKHVALMLLAEHQIAMRTPAEHIPGRLAAGLGSCTKHIARNVTSGSAGLQQYLVSLPGTAALETMLAAW